jgi:hypothetical protein
MVDAARRGADVQREEGGFGRRKRVVHCSEALKFYTRVARAKSKARSGVAQATRAPTTLTAGSRGSLPLHGNDARCTF